MRQPSLPHHHEEEVLPLVLHGNSGGGLNHRGHSHINHQQREVQTTSTYHQLSSPFNKELDDMIACCNGVVGRGVRRPGAKNKCTIAFLAVVILAIIDRFVVHMASDFDDSSADAMNLHLFDLKDTNFESHHSTAVRCPAADIDKLEEQGLLHSQHDQDRCLIQHYFSGICGGRYLEMGALDGDKFSNTYAFYKSPDLGWKGVNIEANPVSYEQLVINRKKDIANVHAVVCSDPQTVHFASGKNSALGGIWEFATPEYRKNWWPGLTIEETLPVQCTPLQVVLDQALGSRGHHFFDFWSLDVTGAELAVLQGTDFTRVGFGIIMVERHFGELSKMDEEIKELLNERGYVRISNNKEELCDTSNSRHYWFVNQDFERIYTDFKADADVPPQLHNALSLESSNPRPLEGDLAPDEPLLGDYATKEDNDSMQYGLALSHLPPFLDSYETEEDFDAAFYAALGALGEEEHSSSPSPPLQPYTLEDVLSESQVFTGIFCILIYDPITDKFVALYSKERPLRRSNKTKLIPSMSCLAHMLRRLFPDRFTPNSPELVLAVASGDYPHLHQSNLPHDGVAPVLMFGSAFRTELYPNMIAMPMPEGNGFHLDCFDQYLENGKIVCEQFKAAGSDGGMLVFGDELEWNDLIPQVIWRGADFGFLVSLQSKPDAQMLVHFGAKEKEDKRVNAMQTLNRVYDHLRPRWKGVALTADAEFEATTNNNSEGGQLLPWANMKLTDYTEGGGGKLPTVGSYKYREWESVGIATAKHMSSTDLARYKYHIDIGGGGGTTWTGTIQKLAMPGLLFHHVTPTRDYIHDRLKPWKHYIPVSCDLKDLKQKFDWAESHPIHAKTIASAGAKFMRWLGTPEGFEQVFQEDFVEPLRRVIEAYHPVSSVHPDMPSWKELLQSLGDQFLPIAECSGWQSQSCRPVGQ